MTPAWRPTAPLSEEHCLLLVIETVAILTLPEPKFLRSQHFVSLTLLTARQSACTLMLELQYASEALSGKLTEARMRQPLIAGNI